MPCDQVYRINDTHKKEQTDISNCRMKGKGITYDARTGQKFAECLCLTWVTVGYGYKCV